MSEILPLFTPCGIWYETVGRTFPQGSFTKGRQVGSERSCWALPFARSLRSSVNYDQKDK